MRTLITLALLVAAGCASAPAGPPAPWTQAMLTRRDVALAYEQAWKTAPNRATCLPLAPRSLGVSEPATARVAQFAGGWGVAWDLPGKRSAFGVAGTGLSAKDGWTYQWPYNRTYGSVPRTSEVGYGLEGGTGPNWLAYIRISEQDCLYNIWSSLGRDHLEQLIESLRFVDLDRSP